MEDAETFKLSEAFSSQELPRGVIMTHKIPPAFDGRSSWFHFEENVLDWQDSCSLEKNLRGPALKNRLQADALIYKPFLDRDRLKDEDTGVQYFLDTLRPKFVKGSQSVFLYRLFQFLRVRRGATDIVRWIPRYQLIRKRLAEA